MVQVTVDGETVEVMTVPALPTSILRAAGLAYPERYDLAVLDNMANAYVLPPTAALTPTRGTQYISARKSTTTA